MKLKNSQNISSFVNKSKNQMTELPSSEKSAIEKL